MSDQDKVVVIQRGPHDVALIEAGLVRRRDDGTLEPNYPEISRRFVVFQEAFAEVGRVMLEVLTPTIEKLGALMREPAMRRLLRAAEKRERYNRKMSERARRTR